MFTLSWLSVLASALLFRGVLSAPMGEAANLETRSVEKRAPAAPHFVLYTDAWVSGETGPPSPSVIEVSGCLRYQAAFPR